MPYSYDLKTEILLTIFHRATQLCYRGLGSRES